MPASIRPGDVLAGRYRLDDLLHESGGGRFWRAHDSVLSRHVAVHVIAADDARAIQLLAAARKSVTVMDRRFLRVLDADEHNGVCYVVNEWGEGTSLDILLAGEGPLEPRRAAWFAAEVAGAIAAAHAVDVTHGRLIPENVLLDHHGSIRVIGLAVDAALHGMPPAARSTDLLDLAGVLYAGLTGRWAGATHSVVPRALVDSGRVLRPRRMRAGIPRPLDELCEDVLNPPTAGSRGRTEFDLATARGIADRLHGFVGDPTGLAPAERPPVPQVPPLPPEVFLPVSTEDDPAPAPAWVDQTPALTPEVEPAEPAEPSGAARPPVATEAATEVLAGHAPEQPTEAGMPIFDDDTGGVEWLTARASKPPPPPPFEEPPERPLFAPAPPPGTPARTPRAGQANTGSQEFWPWEGTGPGTGTGTGSGVLPITDDDDTAVPGRRSMRLAAIIAAAALLMLAIATVAKLSQNSDSGAPAPDGGSSSKAATTGSAEEGTPITGLRAFDFDPQGDPPSENPELAPAAVDGDPTTAWRTETYKQNLGPGGLKTGVGLVIDLGGLHDVRGTDLTFLGAPTSVSVYVTETRPEAVESLTAVVEVNAPTRAPLTFGEPVSGRYVTLWLTSLPAVDGGFRGQIAEVVVRE